MILPRALRVADPLLEDPLRLLDKLPVQINRVPVHPAHGVVLPEDVVRRLPVVLVRQRAVSLALFRELVRGAAVAASVGLVGLRTFVSERWRGSAALKTRAGCIPGISEPEYTGASTKGVRKKEAARADLGETGRALASLLAGEVAQAIVLGFGGAGLGLVVESYGG